MSDVASEDRSADRVARNDATFRAANEAISMKAHELAFDETIPFICECADEACTELVGLSRTEYEHVRAKSEWFLNAVGHDSAAGPHAAVVETHDGYVVVEKLGAAAEVVRQLDPRLRR